MRYQQGARLLPRRRHALFSLLLGVPPRLPRLLGPDIRHHRRDTPAAENHRAGNADRRRRFDLRDQRRRHRDHGIAREGRDPGRGRHVDHDHEVRGPGLGGDRRTAHEGHEHETGGVDDTLEVGTAGGIR